MQNVKLNFIRKEKKKNKTIQNKIKQKRCI